MPLYPLVEKPLNSKVIKSFVPELRSRYMFFEFQDSYVLSLWTFNVRFIQPYHGYGTKALIIHSFGKFEKNTPTIPIIHRPVSLPTNIHNKPFNDIFTKLGILIIKTISQTIKNPTNISKRTNDIITSHVGIYSIPCNCDKYYIGETQRNLDKKD